MSAMGYCWVASNERGTFAACADEPEDRVWVRHTDKTLARWAREGHKIERVTTEEARARLTAYKPLPKPKQHELLPKRTDNA